MHGPDGAVRAMEMLDRERIDNVHARSAISAVLRFTNVMQTLDERQRANGSKQTHSFRTAAFAAEAHRQSQLVARSQSARQDQEIIDAISATAG
jgi:hypothetical protein